MRKLHLVLAAASVVLVGSPLAAKMTAAASSTTIMCKDGTTSNAKTTKGACSRHGGVDTKTSASTSTTTSTSMAPATNTTAMAPAATTATKTTATTSTAMAAGGHTAMCNDGTYSDSKQHSGACSHHKGVKQWLAK